MRPCLVIVAALAACGSAPPVAKKPPPTAADEDPDGPHRALVEAQVRPLVDGEVVASLVVGLYDQGKLEIYGFGKGPGGKPPTGRTLYEIGSITKIYTSLLLADAVQRREVALDTPLSDLLPPGVTAPVAPDAPKVAITLRHLALHSSGLPRIPPSLAQQADSSDPYGKYDEEALYRDLISTRLDAPPGQVIAYSNYGAGVLGFVLGKKLGSNYAKALQNRVIGPLALRDTYLAVPSASQPRRAVGTDPELQPVPPWTFDALAGAGALVSDARDQLALVAAELDAAAGGKAPLRAAMRLTQEPALDHRGENEGLGWQIDTVGRYWHNGGTGGFRSFVGFDPKGRQGVVVLSSTATSLVDRLADQLFDLLAGHQIKPAQLATAAQLAAFVGKYDLSGEKLAISQTGSRLYIEGRGVQRMRLVPISDHEFWIESLQSFVVFDRDGDKISRLRFVAGGRELAAPRVE